MFSYVKGALTVANSSSVVIETAGIGYLIYIPASVFSRLPVLGSAVCLYTSYVVRELSHTLYGFLSEQERDLFETLMGVTGIGPKLALSIIGHLKLHDLHQAISCGDFPTICKVPGIGRKTAERLVIELRDKLPALDANTFTHLAVQTGDPLSQKIRDAMGALVNLGYNQNAAEKAIKKTLRDSSQDVDLATLITQSLKHI